MMMPQYKDIRSQFVWARFEKVPKCVGTGIGEKKNTCSRGLESGDQRLVICEASTVGEGWMQDLPFRTRMDFDLVPSELNGLGDP